jgi:DNA-binding response OmpR family regulator
VDSAEGWLPVNVLIVEDDPALGHFLDQGLKLDGHDVSVVTDGEAALESAAKLRPELMILDLGLPRMDGMEVLAEMQQHFRSTSVLVLTGRAEMEERVKCLRLGADDVVMKPFSFHELRARLQALSRRRGQFEDPVLRYGDLEMDRPQRRVTQGGCEVELTATEFTLLESLMRRRGERVCSRAELLREVWRMPLGAAAGADRTSRIDTNIVEVYINYLRKKLGRNSSAPPGASGVRHAVIRTVRGEGYLLDAAEECGLKAGTGNSPQDRTAIFALGGCVADA